MTGLTATLPGVDPGPETAEEPAGIYIHIPYCRSKCPYCSFDSRPLASADEPGPYLEALLRQARVMAGSNWARSRQFNTLYIGGGTPTICDWQRLAAIVRACLAEYRWLGIGVQGPEITIEMNPNTMDQGMLAGLRQAGVNRLSIGVQAFSDPELQTLGRTHSAAEAIGAVTGARQAGFANISIDLMYGLPGQGVADWRATLEQAVALAPEHVAAYELTIEEGTPFAALAGAGQLELPDEDTVVTMMELTAGLLGRHGYQQYEISNYSRTGYASRHNINYWRNGSYLGLGAGSVSCFSGLRIRSVSSPEEFISTLSRGRVPFLEGECLSREARFRETVIMGLRMLQGVSKTGLFERFGLDLEAYYGEILTGLCGEGLVTMRNDRLCLTARGRLLANQVLSRLV